MQVKELLIPKETGSNHTNHILHCFDRCAIDENDGAFIVETDISSGGWVHMVMIYHGVGLGITVYHDGTEVGADTEKAFFGPKPMGNGQTLIGKRGASSYTSVSVDEVKFYNRQLSQEEIGNMYKRL